MTRQSPPSKQLLEMIGPTLSPLSLTPHSLNNGTDKTVLSVTRLKIIIISPELLFSIESNIKALIKIERRFVSSIFCFCIILRDAGACKLAADKSPDRIPIFLYGR